jgi:hypothetical protein
MKRKQENSAASSPSIGAAGLAKRSKIETETPSHGCLCIRCPCNIEGYKDVDFTQLLADAETDIGRDGCSQLKAAQCLEFGLFTGVDKEKATVWYESAVKAGNSCAQYILGMRWRNGQNWFKAEALLGGSASRGNPCAQYEVADKIVSERRQKGGCCHLDPGFRQRPCLVQLRARSLLSTRIWGQT